MAKNILFIMSDDHGAQAISCYGSKYNTTPNLDRLAEYGAKVENCLCTNSICAPSRAVILTGKHSHLNGVTTLEHDIDARQPNVAKELQKAGYQTAMIGKWHMGHGGIHNPQGFDYWNVFYGQGPYFDPLMCKNGEDVQYEGYSTDIITDLTIEYLENRDKNKPFFIMCHHKAPHRRCDPSPKYMHLYEDIDLPIPDTFHDEYDGRSDAVKFNEMNIMDLTENDVKEPIPQGLSPREEKEWKYQKYFKDYLRCVASIDDSVGEILDYLEENNLAEDTVVMYTSDQGFFIGEHGWFDKRYMLEESMKMPLLVGCKGEIPAGTVVNGMVCNIDFPVTFLDYADVEAPDYMQGVSVRDLLKGNVDEELWENDVYYRYWTMNGEHGVAPHYGIRTKSHKLICYIDPARNFANEIIKGQEDKKWPQWELFDIVKDPEEVDNMYYKPENKALVDELTNKLAHIKLKYKD